MQNAIMDDVTGFNQKTSTNDGEILINKALKDLEQRYSKHIIDALKLFLAFEEKDRPNFIELAKIVLSEGLITRKCRTCICSTFKTFKVTHRCK